MAKDREVLEKTVACALSGKGAHVAAKSVFDGLDWKAAGAQPGGTPHSIFQLLKHMAYWNQWVVRWLDGESPAVPTHAAGSWPEMAAPATEREWQQVVREFKKGLEDMSRGARNSDLLAKHGTKTRLQMLQSIASHNSYHIGQVVLLRQMLGTWPPPSGGLTW